jgi:hypothetical protein
VTFGRKIALALDRYLRLRASRPFAHLPNLWLGLAGAMTPSGLYQVVAARDAAAGLPRLHPHQFRHSFADSWPSAGGNEGDLMPLAGWRSRQMVDRYASRPPSAEPGRRTAPCRSGIASKRTLRNGLPGRLSASGRLGVHGPYLDPLEPAAGAGAGLRQRDRLLAAVRRLGPGCS